MLCGYPIKSPKGVHPCGQCSSCLINKRRKLTARLILESKTYSQSSFLTLTYAKAPPGESLDRQHLRGFLNKLRTRFKRRGLPTYRYFAVGEYGSQTQRPHYHAIIFGHNADQIHGHVHDVWNKGFTTCQPMVAEHMPYCAHYTTKKMSKKATSTWLQGRIPEFASRSAGLGLRAIPWLAAAHDSPAGQDHMLRYEDIIRSFKANGKEWPLDQYMQDKLRAHIGIPKPTHSINWDDWDEETWLVNPNGKVFEKPTEQEQLRATARAKRISSAPKNHGVL